MQQIVTDTGRFLFLMLEVLEGARTRRRSSAKTEWEITRIFIDTLAAQRPNNLIKQEKV